MAQHVLSLDVPDIMNKSVLRIVDTSVYNSMIPVVCPLLQITLPGFSQPVQLPEPVIAPEFILNLTACDLEIQSSGCGTNYNNLPDGIYIIKYSVSPNETVYVEYNHLRTTCTQHSIQEVYCALDLGTCDPPADKKKKLQELQMIEQYIKAAKAMVEFCHQPSKGMNLFTYANKLLDKLMCSTCRIC